MTLSDKDIISLYARCFQLQAKSALLESIIMDYFKGLPDQSHFQNATWRLETIYPKLLDTIILDSPFQDDFLNEELKRLLESLDDEKK